LIWKITRLCRGTYGVAVDVLGDGVNDNVGTVVQGVLDIGAHKGVVNDNEDATLVGDIGNKLDINQAEGGVGGGFDPDELSLGADQLLDLLLNTRRERDLDTVRGGNLGEVPVSAAVHIRDGDDVRASGQRLEDYRSGCGA
jgi:hypothetical protein